MIWRMRFSLLSLAAAAVIPASASADTFSFTLAKANDAWTCTPQRRETAEPIAVAVAVRGKLADAAVKLTATVDWASGEPLKGALVKSTLPGDEDVWRLTHDSTETKARRVTIAGTIEGKTIDKCTAEGAAAAESPRPPVSGSKMTEQDFAAADWLATHDYEFDLLRAQIARENPKRSLAHIVFLPHLPSGAKAPSYPTSISERDLAQVVMVMDANTVSASAVDWSLTRCESIPLYRVYGSIEGLGSPQSAVAAKATPRFTLRRIGHPMSCGADALSYSITVSASGGTAGDPIASTVPVRPVYHLGATGVFGFDATLTRTFVVRDGKIDDQPDRVGSGLLVGATYFVNGVDFGDMRWYNYVANPFVVVSLEAPKERFVVGTALTERGGISLALGLAVNHVSKLASGYSVGQAFTGQGDIPLDKEWKYGFYIGVAVDDKLLASFRKLHGGGTGGGSAAADAEAAAKQKQAAELARETAAKDKQ